MVRLAFSRHMSNREATAFRRWSLHFPLISGVRRTRLITVLYSGCRREREGEEMVYASLPSRKRTTRWRRTAHHALAFLDGALALAGIALIVDSIRSFFTPD